MTWAEIFAVFVKFFFILTPFFIVAVFIAMTEEETVEVRHQLAVRITIGVIVISLILFFQRRLFSFCDLHISDPR